jgi:hypothetical protein
LTEVFHIPAQLPFDDGLEMLPPLPASPPLSPDREAHHLIESRDLLSVAIPPVEQTEEAATIQERVFDQNLEALPPLPESRPGSPILEVLAPAVELLPSPVQQAKKVEQAACSPRKPTWLSCLGDNL